MQTTAKRVLIRLDEGNIFTGTATKVTPTAMASMLVATAAPNMTLNPNPGSDSSSSAENASLSMLMPRKLRIKKAIQEANLSINEANPDPRRYPRRGMIPWKSPNHIPQMDAFLIFTFLIVSPLQTETAKASMASPTDRSSISPNPIYHLCL